MVKSKMPLVTIVTVVYNGAGTIERTIQSAINQTYENIEYIIIDGASTDGTQDIVGKYKDNISYFVSEKDGGLYDAMNKGIKRAKGDIIGIINSDDWYETDTVEQIVDAFKMDKEVGVVYGNLVLVEESGEQKLKIPEKRKTIWYQMAVPHPTVFVKKSIYDRYGIFDLDYKIAADYELVLRLYVNGVKFSYINRPLAYFSVGGMSQKLIFDCAIETDQIAYKYMSLCNEGIEVKERLKEMGGRVVFYDILQRHPDKLEMILDVHFQTKLSEIVIFGAGEWGKQCCQTLDKTRINVRCFADNYVHEEVLGKKVVLPGLLTVYDYVLIAVQNNAEIIEKQLRKMKVVNIISISELIDWYLL